MLVAQKTYTKMSTIFKTTLGPILSLGKILGLINISYILESDGLLIKNINSQYYTFLEVSRMIDHHIISISV